LILRLPTHDPADMRPVRAVSRAVWIFIGFSERVVDAVSCDPRQRTRLQSQRSEDTQCVLDPFRAGETAMRQQPVIADTDAEAAREPPQNERRKQVLPAEKEEGRDRQ